MKKQKNEPLTDDQLFLTARRAALGVEFIQTVDELRLYTRAIYGALLWGKNVNARRHRE